MGRGRRPLVSNSNDWQSVFYNSVGSYVQLINFELAKTIESEALSKHIRIAGGFAFKSSSYVSDGIPVIRISDFNDEKIILDNVKFYKESTDLIKYELYPGDIVIALTGGTIAKLGIVQEGIGKLYLNQRVGKFEVLNPDEFEAEYVYWIARSVQSIIKGLAWGAAIPNVSPKDIEKLIFPIPDRKTQKGIISFLNDLKNNSLEEKSYFNSEIEEKIISTHQNQVDGGALSVELNQQLSLVKQLRQAFLRDAMQGKLVPQDPNDEPASVLLEKIKTEKEKLIAAKVIKEGKLQEAETLEELLFDIPSHWLWCTLDSICKNITDGTHQTPTYTKTGRMFLSAQNVKPFKFMPEEHKFVSEEAYQGYIKNRKPERGDLLIGRVGAGIGETAVIDQDLDFCIYVSLGLVQPFKDFVDSNYLAYVFNSPYGYSYAKGNISSKGGSAGNFNLGRIRSFLIPFPPLSEQKRIVTKLNELMLLCDKLEASIKESKAQNEALLQQVLQEALEPR
jgi:type I restriction enzyme S subunit